MIWDWIVLVLVIFTAIQIPFSAAFQLDADIVLDVIDSKQLQPILIFSLIVDCMFIMDILINFRTTYVQSSSDEFVRNPRQISIHYLKSWFIIDLLAAIPFDWIMHNRNHSRGNVRFIILIYFLF